MIHVLVIANETAASPALLDALRERAVGEDVHVTVIAPVSEPRHGYVVYQDTRRASAGRRLDKTLALLRESGIRAQGFVVETSPVMAAKDALVQLEPPPTEIVVSTHPEQRSGWMRSNVIRDITKAAGDIPVRHVIANDDATDERNVLVVANETVISQELLDRVGLGRLRAGQLPDRRAAVERRAEPRGREAPPARPLGAALAGDRGSRPGRPPRSVHRDDGSDERRAG